jgi:hypothetical protein
MRSPSARVLINTVDIWAAVQVQDADGGVQFTYPSPTQRAVACSAQPVMTEEIADQDRLIRETTWKVVLGGPAGVKNRDKLVITDPAGVLHTAFVRVEQDQAGRGAAYVVHATERV